MSDIPGLLAKYKNVPDERFFSDVFTTEEYRSTLGVKADVVLDIGALAGEFSAYIYDKAKVIYAIEPYDAHYDELVSNIDTFGLDKIKPFNVAIAGENGTGNLFIQNRGGHRLGDTGQPVEKMTLATFMKNNNIEHVDVLKIDIEGEDSAVFRAEDFITVADKIAFIIGEHIKDMKDFFQALGYKYKLETNNAIYYK